MVYIILISVVLSAALGAGAVFFFSHKAAQNEKAMRQQKELAEARLRSIGDAVITADLENKIEYMNPVAEKLTGWTLSEARGAPLDEVYRIVEEHTYESISRKADSSNAESIKKSVYLINRGGLKYSIYDSCSPVYDARGQAVGMIVVFYDMTHVSEMAQRLFWQANHDPLTGLVNRREFEHRLATLLDTAKNQNKQHALLMMDLDNFKIVNDTCGHSAGDEFLRQITSVMQTRMRGSDALARLGGDEFAVLLEACPLDQGLRIANGIREAIRDFRFVWKEKAFSVGASMGLVAMTSTSEGVAELLSAADESCYEAKNKGRDQVQVYRPKDRVYIHKHADLQMISQINLAFELGNFRLFEQKILPLSGPDLPKHSEILLRMKDKAGNLLPPMAFIPAAERYNLLTAIDRWVLRALVTYLDGEQQSGNIAKVGKRGKLYAINLSAASINDSSFPDFFANLLSQYRLPQGLLCFEVTETTAISNLSKAADLMHQLKTMGCQFALDDFGIGMSSFAYLKYLPVDFLKIDGMFVKDMDQDDMGFAIVEAINRVSHSIGIKTVAECVENEDALSKLKALGVDYAQGFYVAKPEMIEETREVDVA